MLAAVKTTRNVPNYYQKRVVDPKEVSKRVIIEDAHALPNIILAIAPCRSGTTIFLRVFGAAKIEAYNQPLKTILRQLLHSDGPKDNSYTWTVPSASPLYIKETTGPYTAIESRFNPLATLAQALTASLQASSNSKAEQMTWDIIRDKVQLLIIGRNPLDTFYSWKQRFVINGLSTENLLDHFITAYKMIEEIRLEAIQNGMNITHFVNEIIRNHQASFLPGLFQRLRLEQQPVTDGWSKLPALGELGSHITFFNAGKPYEVAGIRDKAKKSDTLTFFPGKGNALPPHETRRILDAGLVHLYQQWKAFCEIDLGLTI